MADPPPPSVPNDRYLNSLILTPPQFFRWLGGGCRPWMVPRKCPSDLSIVLRLWKENPWNEISSPASVGTSQVVLPIDRTCGKELLPSHCHPLRYFLPSTIPFLTFLQPLLFVSFKTGTFRPPLWPIILVLFTNFLVFFCSLLFLSFLSFSDQVSWSLFSLPRHTPYAASAVPQITYLATICLTYFFSSLFLCTCSFLGKLTYIFIQCSRRTGARSFSSSTSPPTRRSILRCSVVSL